MVLVTRSEKIEEYYKKLDRSYFLDDTNKRHAGIDSPLPIGHGQTISQPSLVLEMTKILMPEDDSRVLEIGTGSGYQTALLAKFSKHVYTVEVIEPLKIKAEQRLSALGFENISFKLGDGSIGWQEEAPFDRIMVTAAAGRIPEKLLNQLDNKGRMLIPVGQRYSQELLLVTKDRYGTVSYESMGGVVFVEFVGEYGF
jgi:protein-L-isoaspartate(D-aspartate) O-methyltransferase